MLLGIACLVALFALSSVWHESRKARLLDPGSAGEVLAGERADPTTPGWGEVRIGSASNAAPVFLEPVLPARSSASSLERAATSQVPRGTSGAGAAPDRVVAAGDWELRVKQGDVLSRIVRLHYGRVSPDLEQRLATYNHLADPDRLEVGQVLYLPPEERLVAETE